MFGLEDWTPAGLWRGPDFLRGKKDVATNGEHGEMEPTSELSEPVNQ